MLEAICNHIHNFFVYGRESGSFTITDKRITLDFLVPGQYYRIMGSRFNDGVHQYQAEDLIDETFDGVIWEMRPPRDFLSLVSEIEAWQAKNAETLDSPYTSESFGGYSYTKASSTNGAPAGWQSQFASRLHTYRKLA